MMRSYYSLRYVKHARLKVRDADFFYLAFVYRLLYHSDPD